MFHKDTPYDVWCVLGLKLVARVDASCWWLGDWIVFGERRFGRYGEAVRATGLDYKTLRNYAVVARRFPLSRRRDTLSFQHHEAVCALPDAEQDRWLDLATTNGWSVRHLRGCLREARQTTTARPTELTPAVRVDIDAARRQRWRAAARTQGCSLETWIIRTLDDAAGSEPALPGSC